MLYYASRIPDHNHIRKREPEGYLFCVDVPIARSGTQEYARDEIGQEGDDMVKLIRPEEEVFSEATMSSFEGMPVTNDHPDDPEGVNIDNVHYLEKGHCQNVRRGTGKDRDLLIADLVIKDRQTIEEIMDGKREISCGYTYELCEEDGKYYQRQIRGNHIAIVDKGRAGHRVCIKDSAPNNERRKSKMANKKKNHVGILSRMLSALTAIDAEPEVLEEAIDAIEDITGEGMAEAPAAPEEEAKDAEPVAADPMAAILARLDKLEAAISAKATDEDPEPDPLKKLEDDLDELEGAVEEEEVVPDEDPDEQESHFVDPEEINEEDEDVGEEEVPEEEEVVEEELVDCKARDALRASIKAIRPIIAKLPEAERKKASDAMAAQLRKAYGMAPKAKRNDYLRLKTATRKKAGDSKQADPSDLGRAIMESRNPNYKK